MGTKNALDKAIKICDDNKSAAKFYNDALRKMAEAVDLFDRAQNETDDKKIRSKCSEKMTKLNSLMRS